MVDGTVKNTDLLEYLKGCTDEQLSSVEFLETMMKTVIGIRLNQKTLGFPDSYYDYFGNMQAKQYPNEFAQYLAWLYKLVTRKGIKNYLCIGPEKGGEFFTVDSFFRRLNPNYEKSVCTDIKGAIMRHNFKGYQELHDVEFFAANSHDLTWDDIPFDTVDYCFIDGDHSYAGVKMDFEMVKDHCKYIAFHDIACTIPGIAVKQLWDEIKGDYKHWEFHNTDPNLAIPVGIGVIKV